MFTSHGNGFESIIWSHHQVRLAKSKLHGQEKTVLQRSIKLFDPYDNQKGRVGEHLDKLKKKKISTT